MKKTRRQKRKWKEKKNRKWDLKSGQNGRYNNGEKKGFFCSKRKTKKTEETEWKREKFFCGRKKKKDERERGQKKGDKRTVTTMIISQRGRSKQGIEKHWEDTHLREDDFEKKKLDVLQDACKQQKRRTNDGERTEKRSKTKTKRNKR